MDTIGYDNSPGNTWYDRQELARAAQAAKLRSLQGLTPDQYTQLEKAHSATQGQIFGGSAAAGMDATGRMAMQSLATAGQRDVAGMREAGETERTSMGELGALKRTGMQTGSAERIAGTEAASDVNVAGIGAGSRERVAGMETGSAERIAKLQEDSAMGRLTQQGKDELSRLIMQVNANQRLGSERNQTDVKIAGMPRYFSPGMMGLSGMVGATPQTAMSGEGGAAQPIPNAGMATGATQRPRKQMSDGSWAEWDGTSWVEVPQ